MQIHTDGTLSIYQSRLICLYYISYSLSCVSVNKTIRKIKIKTERVATLFLPAFAKRTCMRASFHNHRLTQPSRNCVIRQIENHKSPFLPPSLTMQPSFPSPIPPQGHHRFINYSLAGALSTNELLKPNPNLTCHIESSRVLNLYGFKSKFYLFLKQDKF